MRTLVVLTLLAASLAGAAPAFADPIVVPPGTPCVAGRANLDGASAQARATCPLPACDVASCDDLQRDYEGMVLVATSQEGGGVGVETEYVSVCVRPTISETPGVSASAAGGCLHVTVLDLCPLAAPDLHCPLVVDPCDAGHEVCVALSQQACARVACPLNPACVVGAPLCPREAVCLNGANGFCL